MSRSFSQSAASFEALKRDSMFCSTYAFATAFAAAAGWPVGLVDHAIGLQASTLLKDGGTLQIGSGGTTGQVVGDIANNGQVVFNRTDALTYGGQLTGSGGVTIAWAFRSRTTR